jgi:fatty acid desaturase
VTEHTMVAVEVGAAPSRPAGRGSDYAELSRRVKQAGLLDRRPAYYAAKMIVNGLLLVGGWAAFFLLGDSWLQLIVAAFLAVAFTQMSFIGHDAGHQQIFRRRRANRLVGLAHGNLLLGLSYDWWVSKHNRHHSHPNDVDRDPDVGAGAIAFTAEHAAARRGLGRVLARHQAYLFFPLLLLEGLHLHVASVRAVLRAGLKTQATEAALLALHFAGYLAAVLFVLSPVRALAFVAVQQGLFGLYLGCSFAPNHKGMPTVSDEDNLDFLRRQVLTSRNVRGGRFIDFLLGGLNYQIEHHLFPSMPRPSLRRAKALVRAFCLQHGLPYHESSLVGSYAQALRHLDSVGPPRRPAVADPA